LQEELLLWHAVKPGKEARKKSAKNAFSIMRMGKEQQMASVRRAIFFLNLITPH
jgi:hypothetical protein